MSKTDLTKDIEKALLLKYLNKGGRCGCEIGCPTGQVDFVTAKREYSNKTYTHEFITTCFEIKISKSDLNGYHGHNFVGDYNYYVVPKELYDKLTLKDFSYPDGRNYHWKRPDVGIVVYYPESGTLRTAKKSTVRDINGWPNYSKKICNESLLDGMLLAWQTGSMQKILEKYNFILPNCIKFCEECGKESLNLYTDDYANKTSDKKMCYKCYKEYLDNKYKRRK